MRKKKAEKYTKIFLKNFSTNIKPRYVKTSAQKVVSGAQAVSLHMGHKSCLKILELNVNCLN